MIDADSRPVCCESLTWLVYGPQLPLEWSLLGLSLSGQPLLKEAIFILRCMDSHFVGQSQVSGSQLGSTLI